MIEEKNVEWYGTCSWCRHIQLWKILGQVFSQNHSTSCDPHRYRDILALLPDLYSDRNSDVYTNIYSDINSDIYIYIYMLYCTIFLDIIPTVTVFGQIFWHVILQISCDIDSDMCSFTLTIALADVMWHIFWNTILHQLWHIFWNLLWPISCIFWHIRCSESGSLVSWSPHFLLVKSLTFLQEKHQFSSPNMVPPWWAVFKTHLVGQERISPNSWWLSGFQNGFTWLYH